MTGEIDPSVQTDAYNAAAVAAGNNTVRMAMGEGAAASPERTPEQYAYYLETYGLGPQEVDQQAAFGAYDGTVGDMLDDNKCPVKDILATAHEKDGIAGVQEKLQGLSLLDSKFKVEIGQDTLKYHEDGKVRSLKYVKAQIEKKQTESSGRNPDFLVR